MEVAVFLITVLVGGAFLYSIYKVLIGFFGGLYAMLLEAKVQITPVKLEWLRVLNLEFGYYQKLPAKSKEEFLRRVKYFYHNKNFIAKGGAIIEDRMKVLICASAAQLTFGLPRLRLPHFEDILIYPSSYFNKRTGRKHMGEINTQGLMVFSLEHIEKSLEIPNDGYNLLLHELAHALRFEDYYPNDERHFLYQDDINVLHHLYKRMKVPLENRSISFLNKYAGSNFEEFFAVSVESFFERPIEFKAQLPDLYACLRKLLNQDPEILEKMNKNIV